MLKKISQYGLAVLFLFVYSAALQAQSNMYYALSTGMYYQGLPAAVYADEDSYYSEIALYEVPAKSAIADFENYDNVPRATAVRLEDRTEFPVYEQRYYKRLAVEEPVYELKADVTPPVSSVNKVMVAPHGYLSYQREYSENYVMPDFRADVWLVKPYLYGSKLHLIGNSNISHTYVPDDGEND